MEMFPLLFIGHGSPMNAIEENEFSIQWKEMAKRIPRPAAIVAFSAHWETAGTKITAMAKPLTIHDFYGFPEELFRQEYPAPGSPALADRFIRRIRKTEILPDYGWGLDHGTWSVLLNMYPGADIPVLQISLDRNKNLTGHFELAQEISAFREDNILFVCSGNVVHNLGMVKWSGRGLSDIAYPWAAVFDDAMQRFLEREESSGILEYRKLGESADLAVPTKEHFLPLVYFTGLRRMHEKLEVHCKKITGGSISMTSYLVI
jgi:4,5-DOPA dioxygenase extradiol